MRNIVTVAERELRAQFVSPIAYGVLTLFLMLSGIMFWMMNFMPGAESSVRPVFGQWMLLLLLFILSMLTMRLLSEEFRSGTIETLMTAPISDAEVILGKFVGVLVFYLVMLAATLIYPVLVALYGPLDVGLTFSCYIGLLLAGSLYIAVGVFFSACTRNQVVAGSASFILLAIFTFLSSYLGASQEGTVRVVLQHLSIAEHYEGFLRGLIDTSHVVFFLSVTALFLFFATKALEFRRWR